MTERTSRIPREELEPVEEFVLPEDRPEGYFFEGERVVIFGEQGDGRRSLKCGTIDRLSTNGAIIVDLDVKPPRVYGGMGIDVSRNTVRQGEFLALPKEPIIMKESEFDELFGDREKVKRWVDGMDNPRKKEALRRALLHDGIIEEAPRPDKHSDAITSHPSY